MNSKLSLSCVSGLKYLYCTHLYLVPVLSLFQFYRRAKSHPVFGKGIYTFARSLVIATTKCISQLLYKKEKRLRLYCSEMFSIAPCSEYTDSNNIEFSFFDREVPSTMLLVFLATFVVFLLAYRYINDRRRYGHVPGLTGATSLPMLGHVYTLDQGTPLLEKLKELYKEHGPIFRYFLSIISNFYQLYLLFLLVF